MNVVIVGCGRVGALLAATLDSAGHEVAIIDTSTLAFDRLPDDFKGTAIRGNGTDEDVLRRAGAERADLFLALTEGDNRNVMSAQIAAEVFDVQRVIAKINDPLRAEAYAQLGIATLCRTELMTDGVLSFLGLATLGSPGVRAPAGQHPGADHPPVLGAMGGTGTGAAGGSGAGDAGSAAIGRSAGSPTASTAASTSNPSAAGASRGAVAPSGSAAVSGSSAPSTGSSSSPSASASAAGGGSTRSQSAGSSGRGWRAALRLGAPTED